LKRLKSFSYFEPADVTEAIKILAEQGSNAYPLAGGTDPIGADEEGRYHSHCPGQSEANKRVRPDQKGI